jgi:DNA gyrase subunit B
MNDGASIDGQYTGDQIEVLKGLEAVRKRPGMYIGNTSERGLHQLVYEAVDNSVDEALAGHATTVRVVLGKEGSCSVEDDGRGIPVDVIAEEGLPAVEVVMTVLHAGGKFGKGGYKVSGGLHGVGISVVNALSEKMVTRVKRDGKSYEMSFERGITKESLHVVDERVDGTGTLQYFVPDATMFDTADFHWDILQKRLRELAFLNRGLSITLRDERPDEAKEKVFLYEGGIISFVEHLNDKKDPLHPIISTNGEKDGVVVECALQWADTYTESIFAYANNINTVDGGMHLTGFRTAVGNAVNTYARKRAVLKESDPNLSVDDVLEGLTAVVSVKLEEPQFEGQTKTKLGNAPVRGIVYGLVNERLDFFFEENPKHFRAIVDKSMQAQRAREAAKKARDLSRRKSALDGMGLPGKLVDCSDKNPIVSEIFLVEGDSAGGTAKMGRNFRTQAILPLRGKILNVWKAREDKVFANEEIRAMITALGTGIAADFDSEKLRYHKIIIMTDADVDGSHIRTLLLTFFYQQMRALIAKGYVYIAMPPLYGVKKGKKQWYAFTDDELKAIIGDGEAKDFQIQQYKGLGEMDAEQLSETTMKIETRQLKRVALEDAVAADEMFTTLMGDKVEPRKEFIQAYARSVKNLDL